MNLLVSVHSCSAISTLFAVVFTVCAWLCY